MTTNELGAALRSGEISMDSFNDKLIELGSGTGELAELARTNSMGLATSFENLKNAAARGMADLVDSFNKLSVAITGKEIAENIDSLKVIVNSSFKAMGSAIEATAPIIILFVSGIKGAIPIVNALTPAIVGLVAAYATYTVITKANAAIQASNATLKVAQASKAGLTLVTKAHTVAITAETGAVTLGNIVIGVMTGQLGLLAAEKLIATAAAVKFSAAMALLSGPIGWVVAGTGLLVAGTIAVVKWLNRSTEEGEKLTSQTNDLADSTEKLNSSLEDSSRSYESNQKSIIANADANKDLADRIDELVSKENKSAAEKKELQSYVDELNNSVHGLNLEYGEQVDALNMTSEQIQNKIDLMKEEEQLHASQERLTEIMREQNEIESKRRELTALRQEWNEKLEEGSVTTREHKKAVGELEEQEGSLSEAHTVAGEERLRVEGEIIESSKAVAEAAERDIGKQILLYESLPDSVKNAVDLMKTSWDDYMNAATDMFDTISDKSELSVSEMIKNLEENQRVIGEWSQNIAILADKGIDEGLLETLRAAGPSSAGHVKALVEASGDPMW